MKVLVAGASGLIGNSTMRAFAQSPGWDVVGVSRRTPDVADGVTSEPLDLTDPDACRALIARHPDITHLAYAAVHERPGLVTGWADERAIEHNLRMLRNLYEALAEATAPLEHITLLHGTKAYGLHTGHPVTPAMVPLRESLPQVPHRTSTSNRRNSCVDDREPGG